MYYAYILYRDLNLTHMYIYRYTYTLAVSVQLSSLKPSPALAPVASPFEKGLQALWAEEHPARRAIRRHVPFEEDDTPIAYHGIPAHRAQPRQTALRVRPESQNWSRNSDGASGKRGVCIRAE